MRFLSALLAVAVPSLCAFAPLRPPAPPHRSLLFAFFCLLLCTSALSQPSIQTILSSGLVSNRFNIVFLSEGYTTNQLQSGLFRSDATNALNALFAHQPYTEYTNYFNAYAISVASPQAGSDHPAWPSSVSTYFNSTFDGSDTVITIPPNWADSNYNDGQGKVDSLLQTFMPLYSLAILLVNDSTSGGSDGFGKTAICSTAFDAPEMLTHETGHVVANLADEYVNRTNSFAPIELPNATQETRSNYIKWKVWIRAGTPIPTPPTSSYASVVGLFQGAQYSSNNWYRPQLDCLMRDTYVPFCSVCSEAMVLGFYRKVRPVDNFSPANTNLSTTTTQALGFSVARLQPSSHNLAVQWSLDNAPVSNATNADFTFLPQTVTNGSHSITATVHDATPLVRNDPTNLLSQSITWNLTLAIPQLQLDSPHELSGGKFVFRVTGTAPQGFVIQTSANLSTWQPVSTNSLTAGQFWYTNPTPSSGNKFFRAKTPP